MFLSLDKSYSEEEEKKPSNIKRCLGHQPKHLKNRTISRGVRAVARTPNKPWWKRRLEGQINELRKDLSRIEQMDRGAMKYSDMRNRLMKK